MTVSGGMGAVVSLAIGRPPEHMRVFPGPIEFVFQHFVFFAMLQIGIALILVLAGRALLHSKRWASLVIQGVASLGLLYMVSFTTLFISHLVGMQAGTPETAMLVFMIVAAGANGLFWGAPLVVTIVYLRKPDVDALLA